MLLQGTWGLFIQKLTFLESTGDEVRTILESRLRDQVSRVSYDHLTTFLPHIARTSHKKSQCVSSSVIQNLGWQVFSIIAWRPAFSSILSRRRMTACLGIFVCFYLMERFVSIFLYRVLDECDPLYENQWRRTDATIYDDLWCGKKIMYAMSLPILYFIVYYVCSASWHKELGKSDIAGRNALDGWIPLYYYNFWMLITRWIYFNHFLVWIMTKEAGKAI